MSSNQLIFYRTSGYRRKSMTEKKQCEECNGTGRRRCYVCGGTGRRRMTGRFIRCSKCGGFGRIRCKYCDGTGKQ